LSFLGERLFESILISVSELTGDETRRAALQETISVTQSILHSERHTALKSTFTILTRLSPLGLAKIASKISRKILPRRHEEKPSFSSSPQLAKHGMWLNQLPIQETT
jgi:hypothetical protein